MPQLIQRFSVELTALGVNFPILIPLNAKDAALRVLCRYEPEQTPPPPKVVLIVVRDLPDPIPLDFTMRNFMLVAAADPLPTDFVKFIGSVPFGDEKHLVNIVETLAITPITKEHPMHPEHPSHKPAPKTPTEPPSWGDVRGTKQPPPLGKPKHEVKPKPPAPKHKREAI